MWKRLLKHKIPVSSYLVYNAAHAQTMIVHTIEYMIYRRMAKRNGRRMVEWNDRRMIVWNGASIYKNVTINRGTAV